MFLLFNNSIISFIKSIVLYVKSNLLRLKINLLYVKSILLCLKSVLLFVIINWLFNNSILLLDKTNNTINKSKVLPHFTFINCFYFGKSLNFSFTSAL